MEKISKKWLRDICVEMIFIEKRSESFETRHDFGKSSLRGLRMSRSLRQKAGWKSPIHSIRAN
jgi:hypothetical protein